MKNMLGRNRLTQHIISVSIAYKLTQEDNISPFQIFSMRPSEWKRLFFFHNLDNPESILTRRDKLCYASMLFDNWIEMVSKRKLKDCCYRCHVF